MAPCTLLQLLGLRHRRSQRSYQLGNPLPLLTADADRSRPPPTPKTHTQFVVDGQWQDGDNHNLQLPPTTAMWSLPLTVGGSTKVREREQTELEIM